ncbi:uncharacterized protein LOC117784710 [Drosophila innubila]|uniref:uncharacterized protein LOC117784710 n=1 Tax=Drosophila innubila TaxID=198719 RepID=UPI00148B3C4B|nr:uncharacterized protein LOC117784710 [Drosophila innubila]
MLARERSFVGRRGVPQTVHCDNATNFVGASRDLRTQAGVKSAKHLLLRTVGSLLLTSEELQTMLVTVKAVLNSRPIGALSDDPSDGVAPTPGLLLVGRNTSSRARPGPA